MAPLIPQSCPKDTAWGVDGMVSQHGQFRWLNPVRSSIETSKILVSRCRNLLVLWLPKTTLTSKFPCLIKLPRASPTSGHISGEDCDFKIYMHLNVHHSSIYNSQSKSPWTDEIAREDVCVCVCVCVCFILFLFIINSPSNFSGQPSSLLSGLLPSPDDSSTLQLTELSHGI